MPEDIIYEMPKGRERSEAYRWLHYSKWLAHVLAKVSHALHRPVA